MDTADRDTSMGASVKSLIDRIIRAYLDGELQVKDLTAALATHLEAETAKDVLNGLVERGRLSRNEADKIFRDVLVARSAENKVAGATATVAGGGAALSAVSAAGSVAGLSAPGITSGLAALGGLVGGGMAAGLVVTAGAAFVAGAGAFIVTKRLVRLAKHRSLMKQADKPRSTTSST